ncbi:MAG TPA: hypothetical protein VLS88_06395 [Polyangiales bacterium]|nr:hypothetical protein [Polyangiales bacterium]
MIDSTKTLTLRSVAVAALVLSALAFVLGGPRIGTGAAVGGIVAVLDAWAITWLARRIVRGAGVLDRGFAAVLLGAKLALLLSVCWALLARWGVDPLGFSVGLGALVLGMLYAGSELAVLQTHAQREAQTGEG